LKFNSNLDIIVSRSLQTKDCVLELDHSSRSELDDERNSCFGVVN
jgi:hypothetical protein